VRPLSYRNCISALLLFTSSLPAQNREFAGAAACVSCHPAQSKNHERNSMTKALQRADASEILRNSATLEFSEGAFHTILTRNEQGSTLTVTDGNETLSARILWAFGLGTAGQTYVFEHMSALFESRVSYYNQLSGLDVTMGALGSKPSSLIEAAGRRMDSNDIRECFGCHSTGGVRKGGVDWSAMTPGISCENCHGPGRQHVAARRSGDRTSFQMRRLKLLSAEDMNELCGACHRTWAQVAQMKLRGPLNVRFQPYRITNSKCFDAEDRKIACTACHDPHSELVKTSLAYDRSCLSCHGVTGTPRKAARKSDKVCHTGKTDCVSCHMPKVALPGGHFNFTDHQIRIARAGDAYPN
jgi:hypothetical protein